MKVAVSTFDAKPEPKIFFYTSQVLAMLLQPSSLEVGPHRSEMLRRAFYHGDLMLFPRNQDFWVRSEVDAVQFLEVTISDDVLSSACDQAKKRLNTNNLNDLAEPRVRALVAAVNAERIAGFPGGKVFLDSVERALAMAVVDLCGTPLSSGWTYRGGLSPTRLRKVKDLISRKAGQALTLQEMAQAAELSIAHFSQMFRESTGHSPHQFILHHRIERAKEMLQEGRVRALDVAIACGFKTQQHFSRVFRQVCGVTPREYRAKL